MTGEGTELGRLAIARFLAGDAPDGRDKSTVRAYTLDLDDFARDRGMDRPTAVADLLSHGPRLAEEVLSEYFQHMSQRGRSRATINRRASCFRELLRSARNEGLIGWTAEVPAPGSPEAEDLEETPYIVPRHAREVDRLDIQHYCFRRMANCNFFARVESPQRILDVGAGTGQWGIEVLKQFPEAVELVGFDLVEPKPEVPARYRSVTGNVLDGLPFEDGQFDFVHQRFMNLGVPLKYWPFLIEELVRVTKPDGWIELAEPAVGMFAAGGNELNRRTLGYVQKMMEERGLDSGSELYDTIDTMLRDHGLEQVSRRELALPVGRWPADPAASEEENARDLEVGMLMMVDIRALTTGVIESLQRSGVLSKDEHQRMSKGVEAEWERGTIKVPLANAVGQKPGVNSAFSRKVRVSPRRAWRSGG